MNLFLLVNYMGPNQEFLHLPDPDTQGSRGILSEPCIQTIPFKSFRVGSFELRVGVCVVM